jgi:hypothetical protein
MKNKFIVPASLILLVIFMVTGCAKDEAVQDTNRPVVTSDSWKEEFDNIGELGARGWIIVNNSDNVGPESWRQGRYESANKAAFVYNSVIGFPAYSASKSQNDFISCDFYAGTNVSNMSVWLISPLIKMKNGDQLSFYTRSAIDSGSYFLKNNVDRLQIRASLANPSTNVGTSWTSTGDFSSLWLDINAGLADGGYPRSWTKQTITVAGITGTIKSRFAFRYFVANGGPDGINSGMVGLDALSFVSK